MVAVGDLHIQNFGSWRDERGRLIWGVNDYDEAATLSFAMDLVRLAASGELACETIPDCELTLNEICETVRDGYLAGLEVGGEPFVLERRLGESTGEKLADGASLRHTKRAPAEFGVFIALQNASSTVGVSMASVITESSFADPDESSEMGRDLSR